MRFIRWLHKWLGLIVGIQLCIWLISGLVMALLDVAKVSGGVTAGFHPLAPELEPRTRLVEPSSLRNSHPGEAIRRIELRYLGERWLWQVQTDSGVALHDASSGERVAIDETLARTIAAAEYAGEGEIRSVSLVQGPTLEAREHAHPLWRVDFGDDHATRYYVSTQDGSVVERRTSTWSVFDVFWMLHTMDFRGRDDFNNPLAVTFAFGSLWLVLSGILLLFRSFSKRDLPRWLVRKRA